MKEKVLMVVFLVFFGIILVVCYGQLQKFQDHFLDNKVHAQTIKSQDEYFSTLYKGTGYEIVYDPETNVMYYMSTVGYNYGLICPLIDADGSPKLYKEVWHE